MKPTRFSTSQEAETAFYEAFERADLDAMMAVWAENEEVACIHPNGPWITGLAEVRESWRQIFAANPRLSFQASVQQVWRDGLLAVHSVLENIRTAGGETVAVLATNAYSLTSRGWRMVLHHASLPPQGAVKEERRPTVLH